MRRNTRQRQNDAQRVAPGVVGKDKVEVGGAVPELARDADECTAHDPRDAAPAVFHLGDKTAVGKVAAARWEIGLDVERLCVAVRVVGVSLVLSDLSSLSFFLSPCLHSRPSSLPRSSLSLSLSLPLSLSLF